MQLRRYLVIPSASLTIILYTVSLRRLGVVAFDEKVIKVKADVAAFFQVGTTGRSCSLLWKPDLGTNSANRRSERMGSSVKSSSNPLDLDRVPETRC
jgi:hypothetical protein